MFRKQLKATQIFDTIKARGIYHLTLEVCEQWAAWANQFKYGLDIVVGAIEDEVNADRENSGAFCGQKAYSNTGNQKDIRR